MIRFLNIIWRHHRRKPESLEYDFIVQEDGTFILQEDGVGKMLTEVGSKSSGFLLHDDGTTLLLDDGGKIKI